MLPSGIMIERGAALAGFTRPRDNNGAAPGRDGPVHDPRQPFT